MEEYMLPCTNKMLFGGDCMGCGIQRAIALLLEGEFVAAFYMYPAIYPLIVFLIVVGLNFVDKSRSYHKFIIIFGILTAVTMVVAYFYKLI